MKPAPFAYHAPESLEEALALLAEHGFDAKPLAGGQSLVPAMNFRLARPAVLVDLRRVPGLDRIEVAEPAEGTAGGLRIGAMTRQRAAERSPLVAARAPLMAEALPFVAHPQIRNRGTIGGSLAHADPAAELPAVAVALEARFEAAGPGGGRRTIAAGDFFTGLMATALEPDELLVGVEIPPPLARTGWAFTEMARRHGDYALVGVAAGVTLGGDGRCERARIVLLSAGERPVVAAAAESALAGEAPSAAAARAAGEAAAAEIDPPGDIHASADYRRRLAAVLVRRAVETAFERAAAAREEGR